MTGWVCLLHILSNKTSYASSEFPLLVSQIDEGGVVEGRV